MTLSVLETDDAPAIGMAARLAEVRREVSPRLSPPPTPWVSRAIHAAVVVIWVTLLGAPLGLHGVWAWSPGVVYVVYDTLLLIFTFWMTLHLLRRETPPATPTSRLSVAVIVAARNEAKVLPATLAALLGQSDPPDRVLIADNGSSDDTPAVLHALYGLDPAPLGEIASGHPVIGWLRLDDVGKARAVNAALLLSGEEVVLTVDADTLLHVDAVAAVRAAFAAEPGLVATTGVLMPVCGEGAVGRLFEWFQTYEYIRNFLSRYAWMRLNSLLLISGAFAGFRRSAVLEVGGFDPDCLVEDYELIHRLKRFGVLHNRGWTTRVLGGARAVTEAPSNTPAFLRQRRRWFGGFLQTQYWYRDMVGDRRYGWLGLAMLPVKAIDTMQPLYGLTAFVLLLSFIALGRLPVLLPVAGVIGAKIVVDLSFQVWAVHLFQCWTGERRRTSFLQAFAASLVEPFSFQLLRHLGAAMGWATFLSGRQSWGSQTRLTTLADRPAASGRTAR